VATATPDEPALAPSYDHLPRREVAALVARSLVACLAPPRRSPPAPRTAPASPRVTILIPTYDWSQVLPFAIRSALAQSEGDFELIVVGDGCTDDTAEVVASFSDPRVRWHALPENSGGQAAPNNAGLGLARGGWVAYLGHDDVWHPHHLETLLRAAERANADVVSSWIEMIGPPGTNYRRIAGVYPRGGYDGAKGIPPSGLMHRRQAGLAIGGWRAHETIWRATDTDFVLRLFEAGHRFASTRALTVYKFNASLRRNSYREKPWHEQAACLAGLERDRFFPLREALAIANVHWRRLPMLRPVRAEPPEAHVPGWHTTQSRRFRGVE